MRSIRRAVARNVAHGSDPGDGGPRPGGADHPGARGEDDHPPRRQRARRRRAAGQLDAAAARTRVAAGQAEDALGDDVALDLAGAAGDGGAERPQVLVGPRAAAHDVHAEVVAVDALRAERLRRRSGHAALGLAAEQLQQGVLGRRLAAGELGEPEVAHQEHRLRRRCRATPPRRGTARRRRCSATSWTQSTSALTTCAVVAWATQSMARSCASEPCVIGHPPFSSPRRFSRGHDDVGEEHLVEVGVVRVGELGQRAARDARRLHVDDQRADAAVLREVTGRCARSRDTSRRGGRPTSTPSGRSRRSGHRRAPGAGREAGEVAAGARLAHADAPGDLGAQRRQREAILLVLGAVVEDRRRDDRRGPARSRCAGGRGGRTPRSRSSAASGVALRPPSSGGQPGTSHPSSKSLRCHAFAHGGMSALERFGVRQVLGRRLVGVEPRDQLGAEPLVVVVVPQAHRARRYRCWVPSWSTR